MGETPPPMRRPLPRLALLGALASTAVLAAEPLPPEVVRAARIAAEANQRLDADGGRLWGRPVAAPWLFVRGDVVYATDDPHSDALAPVKAAGLPKGSSLWSGPLPNTLAPSNTPVVFEHARWAMV